VGVYFALVVLLVPEAAVVEVLVVVVGAIDNVKGVVGGVLVLLLASIGG